MSFTTVSGTVTSVDLPQHLVSIAPSPRPGGTGAALTLELPGRQRITTDRGPEDLSHLVLGQFVRARIESGGQHRIRWIWAGSG